MNRLIAIATLTGLVALPVFAQSYQYTPIEGPYLDANAYHDGDTLNGREDGREDKGGDTGHGDSGYRLVAGYRFTPNLALEASYLDFGDVTANATFTDGADAAWADIDGGFDGVGLALIGRLPIQGGLSVHGKLGMIAWDGDVSGIARLSGEVLDDDASSDAGNDPFFGIGAEYEIQQIIIRGEYERYDIGDSGTDFEIDLVSASLGYRF
ncbi:outer membrane beta-barrel protein [Halomonas aquatica]|uniref:Outer membrane beta-barrel protein n=1 Tax=Halomonas aquatica TaxID=3151123 RepID=A0ABV1NBQ3_9GAMM